MNTRRQPAVIFTPSGTWLTNDISSPAIERETKRTAISTRLYRDMLKAVKAANSCEKDTLPS